MIAEDSIKYYAPDYSFKFDNAKRRCGQCNYYNKTISLSIVYVKNNNEDLIINTILHEIAHAIAPIGSGHGKEWKKICLEVNAKPVRVNKEAELPAENKWTAHCLTCNKSWQYLRKHKNYIHKSCKTKITWTKN